MLMWRDNETMNTSLDELTLQKCVDGELSNAERAKLLTTLNESRSVDHWRTLALTFIENQVLAKAFEMPGESSVQPANSTPASKSVWHRQVRPSFAVAASLLMGMTVGIGGHFWLRSDDSAGQQLASTTPDSVNSAGAAEISAASTSKLPTKSVQAPSIGGPGSTVPVMNVNLGRGSSSGGRISVPVYSPEQLQTLPHVGQLTNIPEDVQQMLEKEGYILDRDYHWCRTRLEDGREVLVPAEFVRVRRETDDSK